MSKTQTSHVELIFKALHKWQTAANIYRGLIFYMDYTKCFIYIMHATSQKAYMNQVILLLQFYRKANGLREFE